MSRTTRRTVPWGLTVGILAVAAGFAVVLWLAMKMSRLGGEVTALETRVRTEKADLMRRRQALDDLATTQAQWRRALPATAFLVPDREGMADRLPALAGGWRLGPLDWTLEPETTRSLGPGLSAGVGQVRLSGSALVTSDLLGFLADVRQGLPGWTAVTRLHIAPGMEVDDMALDAVRDGVALPLVAFDVTVTWEALRREGQPPEKLDPGLPGSETRDAVVGPAVLLLDREAEAVHAAVEAGPWGRPPGFRSLEDLQVGGILYAGEGRWMVWINGDLYEPGAETPFFSVLDATLDTVLIAVRRAPGPPEQRTLRLGETYLVYRDEIISAEGR